MPPAERLPPWEAARPCARSDTCAFSRTTPDMRTGTDHAVPRVSDLAKRGGSNPRRTRFRCLYVGTSIALSAAEKPRKCMIASSQAGRTGAQVHGQRPGQRVRRGVPRMVRGPRGSCPVRRRWPAWQHRRRGAVLCQARDYAEYASVTEQLSDGAELGSDAARLCITIVPFAGPMGPEGSADA
jgi:hypothetical protein